MEKKKKEESGELRIQAVSTAELALSIFIFDKPCTISLASSDADSAQLRKC